MSDDIETRLLHTERITRLLAEGKRIEARRLHNAHVKAQFAAASEGPINLSDLMAGREAFVIDDIKRGRA